MISGSDQWSEPLWSLIRTADQWSERFWSNTFWSVIRTYLIISKLSLKIILWCQSAYVTNSGLLTGRRNDVRNLFVWGVQAVSCDCFSDGASSADEQCSALLRACAAFCCELRCAVRANMLLITCDSNLFTSLRSTCIHWKNMQVLLPRHSEQPVLKGETRLLQPSLVWIVPQWIFE